jgi:hypothetical protein
MSPRLLVLSVTALFTLGCSGAATPVARETPAPVPAPAPATSFEDATPAPAEIEAAGLTTETPEAPPAVVEPAAAATPARFATTQTTTAPAGVIERPLERPVVIVPTTSEASEALPANPTPKTIAEQFDAQLAALLRNEIPNDAAVDIADDDRKLLRSVIDSLASFRMTLRGGNSLRQTKVAPLLDLSEKIRSEIPLSLPTLALCRSVQQFGVYDAIEPARFTAGKETPVVVYCEVDHFRSSPSGDGGWETKLTYEAVLYSDAENAVAVISKKATPIVDRCRNRRRDFFLADRMTIPANLPVGKYVLKVTVIDQLANLVAEKTVPVLVGPN